MLTHSCYIYNLSLNHCKGKISNKAMEITCIAMELNTFTFVYFNISKFIADYLVCACLCFNGFLQQKIVVYDCIPRRNLL